MTLQSSPPISAGDINVELGRARGAAFSITGAEERALAGKPSGAISFSDFLGKSRLTADYIGTYNSGTLTISSVGFGAADANRRVFVALAWYRASGTELSNFSSITIGGVSGTQHNIVSWSEGVLHFGAAIISAAVPSGTSGSVVLSGDGLIDGIYASSVRVVGYSSINDSFSAKASKGSGAQSITDDLNVAGGGAVIIAGAGGAEFRFNSLTFSGATRRNDVVYGNSRLASAMSGGLSAEAGRTITMSGSAGSSGSYLGFVGVSLT